MYNVYTYIYTYIYICTYIYVYIHIYIYIRHTHTHTYIYIYIYIFTHIWIYICMYLCINIIHECLICVYTHMWRIFVRIRVYYRIGTFCSTPGAIWILNTCIYIYVYTYQRQLANGAGPADHTLVCRGLAVVEPVAPALFQLGPALEPLRSTDIEHTHCNTPVTVPQSHIYINIYIYS